MESRWLQAARAANGYPKATGKSGVMLSVRAYKKKPGFLDQVFFNDWLGVSISINDSELVVNPSLIISELMLIRQLAFEKPELVPQLFSRFSVLNVNEKVHGKAMSEYARCVAESAISAHSEEWGHWNELLPRTERFDIPESTKPAGDEPKVLELSAMQCQVVMRLLGEAVNPGFVVRFLWQTRIRPFLGKIKRRMGH